MNEAQTEAQPRLELTASRNIESWLASAGVSLAFTTYQAGKLFLIGRQPSGRLSVFERTFERCMGLHADRDTLWMSSIYQLWRFQNALEPGQNQDSYDAVYIPQLAYTTGDLDIHDMIIAPDGKSYRPTLKSSDIIREALAPDSVAEPGGVLYDRASSTHWAQGLDDSAPDVDAESTGVTLKVRGSDRVRASRLSSLSPSSVGNGHAEGLGMILRDDSTGNKAKQRGLCIHAGFEAVEWIGEERVDAGSIREALTLRGYTGTDAEDAIVEISGALSEQRVRAYFDHSQWIKEHPESEVAQVILERPIAVRLMDDHEERLVNGRIDRLVLGRKGGRVVAAQIVDIKTDRAVTGMNVHELQQYTQKHRAQMDLYRRCLAQMYRLEPEQVEAVLVYTACPGAVALGV